jgi:C1A family cysteine protease
MKPIVFISHIHSESKIAIWLEELTSDLLLGAIDFFVSSDKSSIVGGDKWLQKIEEGLKNASVIIVLCSKESVLHPWINFEAGGAWIAGKRVVPVCHAGMSLDDLPEPLRSLQAYELTNEEHFQDLIGLLAREAGLRPPRFDAKKCLTSLPEAEDGAEAYEEPPLVELSGGLEKVGTGWLMPTPDQRDLTENDMRVTTIIKRLHLPTEEAAQNKLKLPPNVDLRSWCSEPRNQGRLNSSTAHAVLAMIEYFELRTNGRRMDLSRLFVYKHARNLLRNMGDSGATLRSTLEAVRLFGVPSSEYWPYTDKKPDYDAAPPAQIYPMAFNYKNILYFCIDPVHISFPPLFVLSRVKSYLAAGIPTVFGFLIFPSFDSSIGEGVFPSPCPGEEAKWKHAALAIGYDDNKEIINVKCNKQSIGALLIQNSWGKNWGTNGYGWIPYDYIIYRHAFYFWSIIKDEWLDTAKFGL